MVNLKVLLRTFFGKRPVESLANDHISLKEGLINFAVPFLIVAVLMSIEIILARIVMGLLGGEDLVALLIGVVLLIIGLLIAIPLSFIAKVVFFYILGALQFVLAGFYRRERGNVNDFNGGFFTVNASVVLVAGLLMLIPIIGWIAAAVAVLYSIILTYGFVREKFNLKDSQAAIVVLIPTNFLLAILLVVATAISFFLIGSRML